MRTSRSRPLAHRLVFALLGGALASIAGAASPRDLTRAGNDHFAAGRYKEALESYDQAAALAERGGALSAELLHNRAAAHFKLGETAEARELWVKALALRDAAYEARCRYNLGNCDYAEALAAAQGGDAKASLEHLSRAADQFHDAIKLDPSFSNARANLELTQQLRKIIEEQATTQPGSQSTQGDKNRQNSQSQPSSQDSQPQQGEQGDQQHEQQSSTQPSAQPQSQPSGEQDEQQQENQQPGQQQNQNENQSQEQSPSQSQPAQQPPNEDQEKPNPEDSQDEAAESQAAQSQPAAQPLTTAPADEQGEEEKGKPLRMSRQEAERLLQMVRDLEKKRREALLKREQSKQKPVDRDW